MKIKLPNPQEYLGREDLFFEQLDLCFYHAKKAWAKVRKQERYKDSKDEHPWIVFYHTETIEDALDKVDPEYQDRQEIYISIEEN